MKICLVIVCSLLFLNGCAGKNIVDALPQAIQEVPHQVGGGATDSSEGTKEIQKTTVESIPVLFKTKADDSKNGLLLPKGKKVIAADKMPLIQFVHMALRDVMGLPYEASPEVVRRMDPVSMSVSEAVDSSTMMSMIEETLAIYGVAIVRGGAVLKVVSSSALSKEVPVIITDKIRASVALGRVMEFVPLRYVEAAEVSQLSQYMLNSGSKATTTVVPLARFHAILVVGEPMRIRQLKEAIALLDRPAFLGNRLLLVRPVYWRVDVLARMLAKALKEEGIPVSRGGGDMRGVRLIPIVENNSLIVSSPERAWMRRMQFWLKRFDQPAKDSVKIQTYSYFVRNVKVSDIGSIVTQAIASRAKANLASKGGRKRGGVLPTVIVNEKQNSILFIGDGKGYKEFLALMHDLDRPKKSVLIEVIVAEVTLNHDLQFGVEWQLNNVGGNKIGAKGSYIDTLGTLGGLGAGGGGIGYQLLTAGGAVRAKLNALASSGRVKLLSNPTLLALNGESSRLQVGTQLPIVSQEVAPTAAGVTATTGVVRTFVMIDTGVILELTPEIHEGDMVQMKLHQEVSEAGQSATNTPPILKRSIDTTIVAKSGQTVLIGGLISHNDSEAVSKVPLLGDIPWIGQLFRSTVKTDRVTELVVLLTPHVINKGDDLLYYTKAFKQTLAFTHTEKEHNKTVESLGLGL